MKKNIKNISIAIPTYFTIPQKKETEKLFQELGFKNIIFFDDSECVSTVFALEKNWYFLKNSINVLFIDIGFSSMKSYIYNFKQNDLNQIETKRINYFYEKGFGGSYLTNEIKKLIINKFNFTNLSPNEERKILSYSEKLKYTLTLLPEAKILIEDIKNKDYDFILKKEEIDYILKNIIESLRIILDKSINKQIIDHIEIIGGGSRSPMIQEFIKNYFPNRKIGHGLNGDETIALGAAYLLQESYKNEKDTKVKITGRKPFYSLELQYNDQKKKISSKGDYLIKEINIDEIKSDLVFNYDISEIDQDLNSYSFSFHFNNTNKTLGNLKIFNNQMSLELDNFIFLDNNKYNNEKIRKIFEFEHFYRKIGKLKNELEQLIININKELLFNETIKNYIFINETQEITNISNKIIQWIEQDINCTESEILQKFSIIKSLIEPLYGRIIKCEKIKLLLIQTISTAKYYLKIFNENSKLSNLILQSENLLNNSKNIEEITYNELSSELFKEIKRLRQVQKSSSLKLRDSENHLYKELKNLISGKMYDL